MAASPALRVATPPEDEEGQFEAGVGRSITVELLATWNTQLRREATARCPVAGCGITFHSAPQIQSHYVTCSGVSSATIHCHCLMMMMVMMLLVLLPYDVTG
ncbi:hypothetical protein E2C01_060146 [Portunus trituberculatus]|uniref:C2H2-type domain-containing protein n=1 Tax=Portunus trituberculatus TaxID=210409 RepID=A0A5B7H7A2_PORTR|nr:hypothetical protein [Portunus trituberculatus]